MILFSPQTVCHNDGGSGGGDDDDGDLGGDEGGGDSDDDDGGVAKYALVDVILRVERACQSSA